MKTAELTGAALDWAVAKCEGYNESHTVECPVCTGEGRVTDYGYASISERTCRTCKGSGAVKWTPTYRINYSTDWAQGGPIIECGGFCLMKTGATWCCTTNGNELHSHAQNGGTPLIAAMRCYVASKLGDEVEIPKELQP
jgi:hypothetical protein